MFLCYFPATLQLQNLPGDCAREVFKYSKHVANLLGWNKKILESFRFCFFVGDVVSEVGFKSFWLRLPGPEPQPLDGIF